MDERSPPIAPTPVTTTGAANGGDLCLVRRPRSGEELQRSQRSLLPGTLPL